MMKILLEGTEYINLQRIAALSEACAQRHNDVALWLIR